MTRVATSPRAWRLMLGGLLNVAGLAALIGQVAGAVGLSGPLH